jgi:lipopolysaccharide biosynthesis protein
MASTIEKTAPETVKYYGYANHRNGEHFIGTYIYICEHLGEVRLPINEDAWTEYAVEAYPQQYPDSMTLEDVIEATHTGWPLHAFLNWEGYAERLESHKEFECRHTCTGGLA